MKRICSKQRIFSVNGKRYEIEQHIHGSVMYSKSAHKLICSKFLILIEILDRICISDYWLIGGTLLGAARNKCLLPWDNDIDIAITINGYKKIVNNIEYINKQFTIIQNLIGFKIYFDHISIADIFVVDYTTNRKLVYSGPYVNNKSYFLLNKCFPKIIFTYDDIYPLNRIICNDIYVNVPNNYIKILKQNYCKNVMNEVKFPSLNIHNNIFDSMYFQSLYFNYYKSLLEENNTNSLVSRELPLCVFEYICILIAKYNMLQYIK
jgi:phosphorylcholine metabolism protein LicD